MWYNDRYRRDSLAKRDSQENHRSTVVYFYWIKRCVWGVGSIKIILKNYKLLFNSEHTFHFVNTFIYALQFQCFTGKFGEDEKIMRRKLALLSRFDTTDSNSRNVVRKIIVIPILSNQIERKRAVCNFCLSWIFQVNCAFGIIFGSMWMYCS